MGLRFRKSITLCKGVRLNIGKTGVSISAGIPGFRKTIHSSGRVTTSVGIPGSGLYYVDTDHIGKKKKQAPKNQGYGSPTKQSGTTRPAAWAANPSQSAGTVVPTSEHPITAERSFPEQAPVYYPVYTSVIDSPPTIVEQDITTTPEPPRQPSFRDLFENCDMTVNWIDVIANREPVDDNYDADTWEYLHSKAVSVFEGNAEAMLQIIDEVSPYDDLASYASDFSVEMEDPSELSVEFAVEKDIAPRNELQDAVCSVLIRAARDSFALLPVDRVLVHVVLADDTIISARLSREAFASLEFEGKDPSDLLESFEVNMKYSSLLGFRAVERLN